MPMGDHAHWSRYNRVIQCRNVPMAELEVENGYVMQGLQEGPPIDGVRDNEQERGVEGEATSCNMDLDNQLTQEQLHSTPMVVDDSRRTVLSSPYKQ